MIISRRPNAVSGNGSATSLTGLCRPGIFGAAGCFLVMLGVGLWGERLDASTVPVKLKAGILKKVLGYTRTVPDLANLRVVVVHGAGSSEGTDSLARALSIEGIATEIMTATRAAGAISKTDVLYAMASARHQCAALLAQGAFVVSDVVSAVEEGDAVLAIGTKGAKPEIVVHFGALKTSGHEISSKVLALARIVR